MLQIHSNAPHLDNVDQDAGIAPVQYGLDQLKRLARAYQAGNDLPIHFGADHYSRTTIYRDDRLEVVVVCFADGQTTSVHDHQGSNCVIRVLSGKLLESLFSASADGSLHWLDSHCLHEGDVSGLDGKQIHQVSNMDPRGTVLINFYSPPFQM